MRDARGLTYTFQYDRLGRLEWEQDSRLQYLRYGYDLAGNPTWRSNRRNQVVTTSYDTLGRVRHVLPAEGDTIQYRYYGVADSTVAWNSQDRVSIRLDALGRTDTVLFTRGSHVHRLTYSYNPANEMLETVRFKPHSGSERLTTYGFDQFRQLASTSGDSTYYDDDRLVRAQWLIPDETQLRFLHTSDHRLADVTVTSDLGVVDSALTDRLGRRYQVDQLGLIEDRFYERDSAAAGIDYDYDLANQLIRETDLICHGMTSWSWNNATGYTCTNETRHAERAYEWDRVGNPVHGNAVIDPSSNRLISMNGFTFEYDADGNMIRKAGNGIVLRFTWNSLGQLTTVLDSVSGQLMTYGYGPYGNRMRQGEAGWEKTFIYDHGNLVAEIDGAGAPLFVVSYFPGIDAPRRIEIGGSSHAYVRESPNNVIALVDNSHNVVQRYRYASFGEALVDSGSVAQPLRYGARELDEMSGLYYNRARWYDPEIGRFISEDPNRSAANLFAYADNNPVNAWDPSGREPIYLSASFSTGLTSTILPTDFEDLLNWLIASGVFSRNVWDTHEHVLALALGNLTPAEKTALGVLCSDNPSECEQAFVVRGELAKRVIAAARRWTGRNDIEGVVLGRFIFSPTWDERSLHFKAHEFTHTLQFTAWGIIPYFLRAEEAGGQYEWVAGGQLGDYNMEQQAEIAASCVASGDLAACAIIGY